MSQLIIRVFDVEHGACSMLLSPTQERLAMIDSGHNTSSGWTPSRYIRHELGRSKLDYLFVTNADQDHLSDLDGLWQQGIHVESFYRNRSPIPSVLRSIKEDQCELTNDIERYLQIHSDYCGPLAVPFDSGMGGASCLTFCNPYPVFQDTNNLSMAVFIQYGSFKMLFPGDLEEDGWLKLLEDSSFLDALRGTTILVASHHGRATGFCQEMFNYFTPQAVVISDKPIQHLTQETVPDYRDVVAGNGVQVLNQPRRRHVLTTRRDGDIIFRVYPDGSYNITTAHT